MARLYCQKLFLILFGLCLALSAVEAFLRLFPSEFSQTRTLIASHFQYRFEYDPFLVTKLRPNLKFNFGASEFPNSFRTVSLGYEGIGFRDDGIDSECFAVAVGDSFTEGSVGNEDVWVELLEKKTGLDFVNMGVSGYSPIQYTRMLQRYGAPLRPKLVLWAFFQNDFYDSYKVNRYLKEGIEFKKRPSAFKNWLRQHSHTYQLMRHIGVKMKQRPPELAYRDNHMSFFIDMTRVKESISNPAIQEGWKLTQESLLEAKTICQDIKANLVVILIPYKEQSYWHIVKGLIKDTQNCDVDQFNALMKAFCEEQGIMCLDLMPVFKEHAQRGEQLYYCKDIHWNKEGNHLAAEAILAFLKQQGLLPQKNL